MESLRKQRGTIKGKITRCKTYLDTTLANPGADPHDIITRLECLDLAWTEYQQIHSQIVDTLTEEQAAPEEADFEETEQRFFSTKSGLRRLIPSRTPQSGSSSGHIQVQNSGTISSAIKADVKLPRMDLPSFSGKQLEWQSFRDLFKSIVHNNSTISDAQKLHYLQNSLQDEAKSLLHSIDITDANYAIAWDLLEERFENERQLIMCHIRTMLGQPALTAESSTLLRKLLDTTSKHVRALKSLNLPTQHWDHIIVALLVDKLDSESRKHWELNTPGKDFPSLGSVKTFIEQRCRALEATGTAKPKNAHQVTHSSKGIACAYNTTQSPATGDSTTAVTRTQTFGSFSPRNNQIVENQVCPSCNSSHNLFHCPDFTNLDIKERSDMVKRLRLCFNCLRPHHTVAECPSKSTCRQCKKRHNTLLHRVTTAADDTQVTTTVATHCTNQVIEHQVLLGTALVKIMDHSGKFQDCRVLLDSGSQATLISETCAQRLGLQRSKSFIEVTGIGQAGPGKNRGTMKLTAVSRVSNFSIHLNALIITNLTSMLPSTRIKIDDWGYLDNLNLADADFNKPAPIDMIIGAEHYESIILNSSIQGPEGKPFARNSHFGWVLSGKIEVQQVNMVRVHVSTVEVSDQLKSFWELEEEKPQQHLTVEEQECESIFKKTHTRDSTGRFIVTLPFKSQVKTLGRSKEICMKRLNYIERKLDKNQDHKKMYHDFMHQYLHLGHMEKIPPQEEKELLGSTNYLPHHFVLKDENFTSKFRVVFDGSMKTSTGLSLNEVLMVGATVQDDLHTIISRFRLYKHVFTADIAKMYRQVNVPKKDSDFQRILWRWDSSKPVEEFRLTTVTYGTSAAPFLATRALQQLAEDEGERFPLARATGLKQFYVDDVMSGSNELDTALSTQQQLIQMCNSGGFQLRKWSANHPALLEHIPVEDRESTSTLSMNSDHSVKTLGLHWNPASDVFFFKINPPDVSHAITKRVILSETARLFDPMGWLAPVIVTAKIMLQQLWLTGLGWDEALPESLESKWLILRHQLILLEKIHIQRLISGVTSGTHQPHGFCDASEAAYAAVIYLRVQETDGSTYVQLVTAKTRVAPVKQISLPKLELCGAVLVSKLIKKVTNALSIQFDSIHMWTDSMITLDWISCCPKKWETFVANRVSEIQSHTAPEAWRFVPGTENPADCASRGILPEELINHPLWFTGPPWLISNEEDWPITPTYQDKANTPGQRKVKIMTVQIQQEWTLIKRYSSISRLKRITAYCLRFINNMRRPKNQRVKSQLTTSELDQALLLCIRQVQTTHLHEILHCIKSKTKLPQRYASLNPFIDDKGFLRVGGRLRHSELPFNTRHPILLPREHRLTRLIVETEHKKHLHSGSQLTLAAVQQHYWITDGRRFVRKVIHNCVKCKRDRGATSQQQMADLPSYRVQPGRPFLKTGVDFGGPFTIKSTKGRGGKVTKCYVCLFVCVSTKAIHLDLVSDLTAEAFIAALRRFVSRRGRPSDLYSDNGTNFVGANSELKKLLDFVISEPFNSKMTDVLSGEGISWHYNPASAPHFGGLWEAGIKSTKGHLRRVIGDQSLTFEEMSTVLTQIEACLNSRPICALTTDPSDPTPLTPGHFLIGGALTAVADPDLTYLPMNRLSRWQLVQRMTQHFWRRWHTEYLVQLQQRYKWSSKEDNAKIGDVVLIKDENTPPQKWPMGRIVTLHPGKDNLVRTVSVKTINGIFKRPIVKLCLLPIDKDE